MLKLISHPAQSMDIVLLVILKENWSLFGNTDQALLQLGILNGMCVNLVNKRKEKEDVVTWCIWCTFRMVEKSESTDSDMLHTNFQNSPNVNRRHVILFKRQQWKKLLVLIQYGLMPPQLECRYMPLCSRFYQRKWWVFDVFGNVAFISLSLMPSLKWEKKEIVLFCPSFSVALFILEICLLLFIDYYYSYNMWITCSTHTCGLLTPFFLLAPNFYRRLTGKCQHQLQFYEDKNPKQIWNIFVNAESNCGRDEWEVSSRIIFSGRPT